jgi:hypothetical protein
MNIERKLKQIGKILEKKDFVRIEVETINEEDPKHPSKQMFYLGNIPLPTEKEIYLFPTLYCESSSGCSEAMGKSTVIPYSKIKKLTILKTR